MFAQQQKEESHAHKHTLRTRTCGEINCHIVIWQLFRFFLPIHCHSWSFGALGRPNFREGAFYESACVCILYLSVVRQMVVVVVIRTVLFCFSILVLQRLTNEWTLLRSKGTQKKWWQRQPRILVKNREIMWKLMGKFMERITRPPTKKSGQYWHTWVDDVRRRDI